MLVDFAGLGQAHGALQDPFIVLFPRAALLGRCPSMYLGMQRFFVLAQRTGAARGVAGYPGRCAVNLMTLPPHNSCGCMCHRAYQACAAHNPVRLLRSWIPWELSLFPRHLPGSPAPSTAPFAEHIYRLSEFCHTPLFCLG